MSPSDFWKMHPEEFFWQAEARKEMFEQHRGGISESEAIDMKQELREARIRAGFPPE